MIKDKRIIVTGGAGFLGSAVVRMLEDNNEVFIPRSSSYDLKERSAVQQMFSDFKNADYVIHAAADIGGIGYSSSHPATQFYNNALINLNMVHESYKNSVKKFVGIGSVCEYPSVTPVPFREEELWNGYPVKTNDAYGLTKRMLLAQCDAYREQYGFSSIHLLPVNLYGPRDDFDLSNSHVIPALIRKIDLAITNGHSDVEVWGTGDESREFVYVEDAARAIVMATEKYEGVSPVNIGSGCEITIKELANLLKDLMGYKGSFKFINNGLGGQSRRMLDVSLAKKEFGFESEVSFANGLKKTVEYYDENKEKILEE